MTCDGKQSGDMIMGMMIPQSYKKLELEIIERRNSKERNNEVPIISREEFIEIGKSLKCTSDQFHDDDIEAATQFLHYTGFINLFYFL